MLASVYEPEISTGSACHLRGLMECHGAGNITPILLQHALSLGKTCRHCWSGSRAAAQRQKDLMVLAGRALLLGHDAVAMLTNPVAGKHDVRGDLEGGKEWQRSLICANTPVKQH